MNKYKHDQEIILGYGLAVVGFRKIIIFTNFKHSRVLIMSKVQHLQVHEKIKASC